MLAAFCWVVVLVCGFVYLLVVLVALLQLSCCRGYWCLMLVDVGSMLVGLIAGLFGLLDCYIVLYW